MALPAADGAIVKRREWSVGAVRRKRKIPAVIRKSARCVATTTTTTVKVATTGAEVRVADPLRPSADPWDAAATTTAESAAMDRRHLVTKREADDRPCSAIKAEADGVRDKPPRLRKRVADHHLGNLLVTV